MLELKNIVKDYVSGNNVTHALKGISVNFRKNEFVSILGASGCGKTTTLNIVGGLDRYTSGDLIINGKSTKDYSDRDWDTYRNHSIGFIFQSYNLIGHQNILKNVELALTIAGVDRVERKQRAMKALEIVGLAGMEKKKPNQLSGGQCQRVAIARALINNPEILLADEPTGALDSETSVQIMDLLKEVAKDRLVIMVTHNPDLAKKYSTRIITMSDGVLLKDSNPFDGKEEKVKEVSKGKKKQSSMSLLTSTGLSLSNLGSKLKRTILVTIAGSIGIIGVSAVLAVSRGVKDFIKLMQNDMLSNYPIGIAEESVDYTSLMSGLNAREVKDHFEFDPNDPKIGTDSMINYLMTAYSDITKVKTNTIDEKLMAYIDQIPEESVAVTFKNYGIDVTNNIFSNWKNNTANTNDIVSLNGLTQSYISELKTVDGFSSYAAYVDLFSNFMKEIPDNEKYIKDQYDIIAGDLSFGENDLVLVVDKNTTLTDLLLAQTGIFEHDEFINIAECALKENDYRSTQEYEEATKEVRDAKIKEIRDQYPYRHDFKYSDLLDKDFYYYPQDTIYSYNEEIAEAEKQITVSYVVTGEGGSFENLVYLQYQEDMDILVGVQIDTSMNNQIVTFTRMGPASPVESDEDIVKGAWIGGPLKDGKPDTEHFTPLYINGEFSTIGTPPAVKNISVATDVTITPIKGYAYNSEIKNQSWITNPSSVGGSKMKISSILRLKDSKNFGCLDRGLYYTHAFGEKFINDSKEGKLTKAMENHIQNKAVNDTQFNAYVTFSYLDQTNTDAPVAKLGYASSLNGDMTSSFADLFSNLTGVNYMETNSVHLRSVSGLKTIIKNDEHANFESAEFAKMPKSISIYPNSFADKDIITDHLDKWNSENPITVKINGVDKTFNAQERDELTYSDTIEIIIAVITTFIDAITIALVVFTSLSLVVSCFMIAVITYISVVERIKEIGIIRSLGGRKQNVASLFIMENLLTGLFSGGFGIGLTYILQVVLNAILKAKFNIVIANLTPVTALIMIGISILLSVLSGLIPSQSAAHKDPVVALRSNE